MSEIVSLVDIPIKTIPTVENDNLLAKEILEKVSKDYGLNIPYASLDDMLTNFTTISAQDLKTHHALNAKLIKVVNEAITSKAILSLNSSIQHFLSSIQHLTLNTPQEMSLYVNSLREIFNLLNNMQDLEKRIGLSDPDQTLKHKKTVKKPINQKELKELVKGGY